MWRAVGYVYRRRLVRNRNEETSTEDLDGKLLAWLLRTLRWRMARGRCANESPLGDEPQQSGCVGDRWTGGDVPGLGNAMDDLVGVVASHSDRRPEHWTMNGVLVLLAMPQSFSLPFGPNGSPRHALGHGGHNEMGLIRADVWSRTCMLSFMANLHVPTSLQTAAQ